MSTYVGNLPYQVNRGDLNEVFAAYSTVKGVQLPTKRETKQLPSFGFAEMETEAEKTTAIEALNGAEWMGCDLKFNKSKPRENRSSGDYPGGYGGGGGRRNRY